MSEQVHPTRDAFCDGNVERAATEVIDDKHTVVLPLPHHAHHGSDRLLHQGDAPEARCIGGGHRRVLLHLVKRSWNRDDGAGVAVATDFFRQVAEQGTQHLGGALLRRHGEVDCGQLHWRARAHEALEQHSSVVGIARGVVVCARADVFVSAPVDEDGGWSDVVLLRTLEELNLFSVERGDGTVGRAEIDSDVFHAPPFLSITVPCLRRPFGPMMIGSTI